MLRRRTDSAEADFDRLVAESSDRLLRTAFLLCSDLSEAEDLVQETWTRIARRWPRIKGMQHPAAYARRVLVNLAIDSQPTRTRHRGELSSEDEAERPDVADFGAERALRSVESHDLLAQALAELTTRQRAVLVLRYWDDLPEQQVAEILGCSVGTIKSTASKALSKLRANLTIAP
jgi:RNA polymerase sigma-70 factor (sigma-E family)